jgi:hypothetical protein
MSILEVENSWKALEIWYRIKMMRIKVSLLRTNDLGFATAGRCR